LADVSQEGQLSDIKWLNNVRCVYVQMMYNEMVEVFPEFDWDKHDEHHLARHGISRRDAEDVLSGSHILLEYQTEGNEQRWIAVGQQWQARY
jgi:hypothetical protein